MTLMGFSSYITVWEASSGEKTDLLDCNIHRPLCDALAQIHSETMRTNT
jgi:hypothetical protein